jgi:hypothetical protein
MQTEEDIVPDYGGVQHSPPQDVVMPHSDPDGDQDAGIQRQDDEHDVVNGDRDNLHHEDEDASGSSSISDQEDEAYEPTDHTLDELRGCWEFACVLHFLELFRNALDLRDFSAEKLETAILEDGSYLIDLHIRILKQISSRKPINRETWEKTLESKVKELTFYFDNVNPLKDCNYRRLPLKLKVSILKALCECMLDSSTYIRDVIKDDSMNTNLRLSPLGRDKQGNRYWYLVIGGQPRLCKDYFQSSSQPGKWETLATTLPELEMFAETFASSKNKDEVKLYIELTENIIPPLQIKEKNRKVQEKRLQKLDVDMSNIITTSRTRKRVKYDAFFADDDDDDDYI